MRKGKNYITILFYPGFDLGYYYKTTYEPAYEVTETIFNPASIHSTTF